MYRLAHYPLRFVLATAVTLGLFFTMQALIGQPPTIVDETAPKIDDIVWVPKVIVPIPTNNEDKTRPEIEPEPEVITHHLRSKPNQVVIITPITDIQTDIVIDPKGGSLQSSVMPLVKIMPEYPSRAIQRGLEGHCTVEYAVTAMGTTRDVAVVENDCTSSLFYKSSIKAAEKFKYQPRVINGEAIEVKGVKNRFTYTLDS